jgi:PRTRC genetic system protein B
VKDGTVRGGEPLDLESFAGLVASLRTGGQSSGIRWAESRHVFHGNGTECWHCPSAVKPVRFKVHGCPCAERLNALDGTLVRHPNLLFILSGGGLRVLACRARAKTWADTFVYSPPYLNVSTDGKVCMPMGHRAAGMTCGEAEEVFFGSAFSHLGPGGNADRIRHAGGVDRFWADYAEECAGNGVPKKFPNEKLVRLGRLKEVAK